MKYNSFVNLLRLDIIISNNRYNAGHTYVHITMQGLVKEVALKHRSNNGLAILHGNKFSP